MCNCKYSIFGGVLAAAAGLSIVLTACGKKDETSGTKNTTEMTETKMASAKAFNTMCLMMDENEVSEKGGTVEYQGKVIGFCCPECIDDWNELTDSEKSEKFAAMTKAIEQAADEAKDKAEDALDDGKGMLPDQGGGGGG